MLIIGVTNAEHGIVFIKCVRSSDVSKLDFHELSRAELSWPFFGNELNMSWIIFAQQANFYTKF